MNAIAPRTARMCGISGQGGAYLAQLPLAKGYRVVGTARDAQMSSFANLKRLATRHQMQVVSMATNDFRSVLQVLSRHAPLEVYHLAGQSSVGLSFEQPVELLKSISVGTLNLFEVICFYNACSGECLVNTGEPPTYENTPFRPRNLPHRRWQGRAAAPGQAGPPARLGLDPQYVDAIWRMLQQLAPHVFIIATGEIRPPPCRTSSPRPAIQSAWTDATIPTPTPPSCAPPTSASAVPAHGWLRRNSAG